MRVGATSSKPSTIGFVQHSARSPPASSTSAAPQCQGSLRDALRRDPSLVRRYADLKRDLAARSPDRDTYTRAKTAFVREILLGAGHAPQTGWASEAPANGD